MKEFPKALYFGNTVGNDLTLAADAEHEAELRNRGYVDFADLPVYQSHGEVMGSLADAVSQAEYDEVVQERDAAFARIAELESIIENGLAENEQLRQELAQPKQYEQANYVTWTADQLRDEITKQGKTFKARDSKAELIAILENGNGTNTTTHDIDSNTHGNN